MMVPANPNKKSRYSRMRVMAVVLFTASLQHFAAAFCNSNYASRTSGFFVDQSNQERHIATEIRSSAAPALEFDNFNRNAHGREAFLTKYNYRHPKAREFMEKSINYYSKVMREERRRNIGQVENFDSPEYQESFVEMAKKHYYAITKVKDGKLHHAENIYRKIIDEIVNEEEENCDHAQLAVTTLLLALLTQRMGDVQKTRSVFLSFFRIAVVGNAHEGKQCACSAKVLTAFALFEMKQGNEIKSLQLAQKALEFDETLQPVLQWKQFRDVLERRNMKERIN